jgi:MoaA/NifB/PqqE/SkfB family radical SAM enzyme
MDFGACNIMVKLNLRNIKEIHIEPTSLCNAECPQCARNIRGKGLNPNIKLGSLDLDFFQKSFDEENVKDINKIFFCGNVGDPCATPDLLKIFIYLKSIKKDIVLGINTNGSLKTKEWFKELGNILQGPLDYVVFSIDGLEDTNNIYRRNTNWQKIIENAESYISTGASAHWDMLIFQHNKHQIEQAQSLAKEIGFSWFRSKITDRWDIYEPTELLKPAEVYLKPNYHTLDIVCEKDRDSSIFIDYTGKVWPCCHMAEAYLNEVGRYKHEDLLSYNPDDLLTEYAIKLKTNPFYVCQRSCGITTGKRSQWRLEKQLN